MEKKMFGERYISRMERDDIPKQISNRLESPLAHDISEDKIADEKEEKQKGVHETIEPQPKNEETGFTVFEHLKKRLQLWLPRLARRLALGESSLERKTESSERKTRIVERIMAITAIISRRILRAILIPVLRLLFRERKDAFDALLQKRE